MVNVLKKERTADCFVVSTGKSIYGVGLLIVGIGIFLLVAELFFHIGPGVPLWIYPLSGGIIILGGYFLLQAKNRRLEVTGNRLVYINGSGRRHEFLLEEIGYAKAAANPQGGQDYLLVYDKLGKRICRLAFHMENAFLFLSYLYDNGVTIDTKKDTGSYLGEIMTQQRITEEQVKKIAEEAYEKTGKLLAAWQEVHKKLEVEFEYGLVQYHRDRIDMDASLQPPDCHCSLEECGELPSDYLCVLEIYIKKDGCFIKDKKKNLLVIAFSLIYKYPSAAVGESFRLCHNANFERELEAELEALAGYLPRHKFIKEPIHLPYELKRCL